MRNLISASKRDIRLDTMRGILLVIMTLNHLGGDLTVFAAQPFGYVTAAEGFILLSAYTYAVTSRLQQASFATLAQTAAKRGFRIYKYHILAFAILFALAMALPAYGEQFGKRFFVLNDPALWPSTVLGTLLLVHQPVYFDILPMYIVFTLLSPVVLHALQNGQGLAVVIGSATLWMMGQYVDPVRTAANLLGMPGSDGYFNPLAWQVLWVAGLYVGFAHKHRQRTDLFQGNHQLLVALAIALILLLSRHALIDLPDQLRPYFGKANLGLLRIVNVAAQLVILCAILRAFQRSSGLPWFRFIGTYSLQVFTFHLLAIYLLKPFGAFVVRHAGAIGSLAYTLAVVASLSIPALLYHRIKAGKIPHSDSAPLRT